MTNAPGQGRKPKPTVLKVIAGNPGCRKMNENEPQPELHAECPEPPEYLSEEAKDHWRLIGPHLARTKLLSAIDTDALAMYCESFAQWTDAVDKIRKIGSVIKSPKHGIPILSPYVSVAHKAMVHMMKLQTEFGMTPSSRTRIAIDAGAKDDDNPYDLIGRKRA